MRPSLTGATRFVISFCLAASSHSMADVATASPRPIERARYLMGTICEIALPPGDLAEARIVRAFEEIDRIERLISTWNHASALSRVNAAPPGEIVPIPEELFELLDRSRRWATATGSAFNPFAGRLIEIWDLRGEGRRPSPSSVSQATADGLLENFSLSRERHAVTRLSGGTFEEGAFGKGYAIDRALDLLERDGVREATINFGGQVATFGRKDGTEVVVAHPADRDRGVLSVRTGKRSASTSSGSEKVFNGQGHPFSHIVDARTGLALAPRGSVTVFADSAYDADVLSTALFVMGLEEGLAWADAHNVAVLFVVPENKNTATQVHQGSTPSSGTRLSLDKDRYAVHRSRSFKKSLSLTLLANNFTLKD